MQRVWSTHRRRLGGGTLAWKRECEKGRRNPSLMKRAYCKIITASCCSISSLFCLDFIFFHHQEWKTLMSFLEPEFSGEETNV